MSKYFTDKETACKCGCGTYEMSPLFMAKLDNIREIVRQPLTLTSARRCQAHNDKVSTVSHGPHPLGCAADIAVPTSRLRHNLIVAALAVGVNRIGIGDNFIHLDTADEVDKVLYVPHLVWTYVGR